jgi:hypothetical protein
MPPKRRRPTSGVVNGRGGPALVFDQTVLQPVHGNATARLQAGERDGFLELITPPAGKMVVIAYVTMRALVNEATANALLVLSGDLGEDREVEHHLEVFPRRSTGPVVSNFQQLLTQHVLLYSTGRSPQAPRAMKAGFSKPGLR